MNSNTSINMLWIAILTLLFIGCRNPKKSESKNTTESTTFQTNTQVNYGLTIQKIDGRRYETNRMPYRYEVSGKYDITNNYIDIEIPVCTNDFLIDSIIKRPIKHKKKQALLIVLKNGNPNPTIDTIPKFILKGKLSFADIGFNIHDLRRQEDLEIKTYILHDECFESKENLIRSYYRKDLKSYYDQGRTRRRGILRRTRRNLLDIKDICKIPKEIGVEILQPRESGGGVISSIN
ncbi:hypothetical protein [Aquimarina pacifica]|uniref:hypothetical protein n=1 Tax=Aquimarina pacifica TaxID=1296415 RepID=UPI00046F708B|nr:hypothetical protein [Aquimarina pacifica]